MRGLPLGVLGLVLSMALLPGRAVAAAPGPGKIAACTTISAPGAYVLTRNLSAAGDCLIVATNHVSIDLDGFMILGNGSGRGITDNGINRVGIGIRNGTISNFATAIGLDFSTVVEIQSLRVPSGSQRAIVVSAGSVVRSNVVVALQDAITTGPAAVVSGNVALAVNGNAIQVVCPSVVAGNTASSSAGLGVSTRPGQNNPVDCTLDGNAISP